MELGKVGQSRLVKNEFEVMLEAGTNEMKMKCRVKMHTALLINQLLCSAHCCKSSLLLGCKLCL